MKQTGATLPSNELRMVGQEIRTRARVEVSQVNARAGKRGFDPFSWSLLLYGIPLLLAGIALSVLTVLVATFFILFGHQQLLRPIANYILVPAGCALLVGIGLIAVDVAVLLPLKRTRRLVAFGEIPNKQLTVVLTSWNDELSIGPSVRDFLGHPLVRRVIVVDNDSSDASAAVARDAGATVVIEPRRGYGSCVYRALSEGAAQTDTDLTLLCEGDMTFRAFDIDKFMAYIPHADIVNGTRIVEQLRARDTQLTTFMYYGNFAVGKLLEAKYLGQGTFTDVGTTYKLCRNVALKQLLPKLNPEVNLEFNAHLLDVALRNRLSLVECPVTFHARVGVSKGGNASNSRALAVGLRMIAGMLFSWR